MGAAGMETTGFIKIFVLMLFLLLLPGCSMPALAADTATAAATAETSPSAAQPAAPTITAMPTKRPPDSDTPAAGICLQGEGGTVDVLLGLGPDDLPLAGRCIQIKPEQRVKLINQSGQDYSLSFGPFEETLPPGGELLLDLPAGDYLEFGVHLLPDGPAIWVQP